MAGSYLIDLRFDVDDAHTIPIAPSSPFVFIDEFMPHFPAASQIGRRSPVIVVDLPSVRMIPGNMVNDVCSICMEDFVGDRTAKRVPCGHVYHGDCISSWLTHSDSCPLCRTTVSSTTTGHQLKGTFSYRIN